MPRHPQPAPDSKPPSPKREPIPYPFIREALAPLNPEVRPMFSGYAVYIGDKIVCMLRDRPTYPEDNGLWLVFADSPELDSKGRPKPALRREFPSLRPIQRLGGKINHWLLVPADSPNFESEATHVCDLLLAHDPRLGRIPKSRSSSPAKKSPKESR